MKEAEKGEFVEISVDTAGLGSYGRIVQVLDLNRLGSASGLKKKEGTNALSKHLIDMIKVQLLLCSFQWH